MCSMHNIFRVFGISGTVTVRRIDQKVEMKMYNFLIGGDMLVFFLSGKCQQT